jgi:hypothetical protein
MIDVVERESWRRKSCEARHRINLLDQIEKCERQQAVVDGMRAAVEHIDAALAALIPGSASGRGNLVESKERIKASLEVAERDLADMTRTRDVMQAAWDAHVAGDKIIGVVE